MPRQDRLFLRGAEATGQRRLAPLAVPGQDVVTSSGVAGKSLHMQGMAIDVTASSP